jgi:hypothetical protein
MTIDLQKVREKGSLLADNSKEFEAWFDHNYYDMIENPEDYFAEGVIVQFHRETMCDED